MWNDDETALTASAAPIMFDEQLALPLLVEGSRAVAIDRSGAMHVLELQAETLPAKLAIVAERSGASQRAAAFAALAKGWLVVGDRRLTGYRIPAARGTLPPQWVNHEDETFVAPLQFVDDYVVHVRRRANQSGVFVGLAPLTPKQADEAGQSIWQTHLAQAPAGATRSAPSGVIEAWCASGDLYVTVAKPDRFAVLNAPAASVSAAVPLRELIECPDGRVLLCARAPVVALVLDDRAQTPRASVVAIPAVTAALSDSVAAWNDGVLLPLAQGSVAFAALPSSSASGEALLPFLPTQRPGRAASWLTPLPIDAARFFVADRAGEIFIVAASDAGALHLAATESMATGHTFAVGPVLIADTALFVARSDEADAIVPISIANLQAAPPIALPGRLVWGPHVVENFALLASDPGGLIAVDAAGETKWSLDLHGELPVGAPLLVGDALWIAVTSGRLVCCELATGTAQREVELAQPLATGPAQCGSSISVRAADGTILLLEAR